MRKGNDPSRRWPSERILDTFPSEMLKNIVAMMTPTDRRLARSAARAWKEVVDEHDRDEGVAPDAPVSVLPLLHHPEALKYAIENGGFVPTKRTLESAVRGGFVDTVAWLFARVPPPPWNWTTGLCAIAASQGHLDMLRLLRSHDPPCAWDQEVCGLAAENGHLEVVEWLYDNFCPWNHMKMFDRAARSGNLALIEWMLRVKDMIEYKPLIASISALENAATSGNLELVQWMLTQPSSHRNRLSTDAILKVYENAASSGNTALLKWLSSSTQTTTDESVRKNSCSQFTAAAKANKSNVLIWLRSQKWGWDSSTCKALAGNGNLPLLKWARAKRCPWSQSTCAAAAANGHLDVLKWARAKRCPWGQSTCAAAAANGHLDVLIWAHNNGCPWSGSTCAAAATNGHFEVLQWTLDQGLELNPREQKYACENAAKYGRLDMLMWMRAERGFEWDSDTTSAAAGAGHLDVFAWTVQNGCTCDALLYQYAAKHGHRHILEWIHEYVKNHAANANRRNETNLTSIRSPWPTPGFPLWFHHEDISEVSSSAAIGGHLNVLEWAEQNGFPIGQQAANNAAECGHIHVLEWILGRHPHAFASGTVWNSAVEGNHILVLQWLNAKNVRLPDWRFNSVYQLHKNRGADRALEWAIANVARWW